MINRELLLLLLLLRLSSAGPEGSFHFPVRPVFLLLSLSVPRQPPSIFLAFLSLSCRPSSSSSSSRRLALSVSGPGRSCSTSV